MRAKRIFDEGIDYEKFDNPYTGLAAMVIIQAADDLSKLKGRESMYVDTLIVSQNEIKRFFCSRWAAILADAVNLDRRDMMAFVNAL